MGQVDVKDKGSISAKCGRQNIAGSVICEADYFLCMRMKFDRFIDQDA